MMMPANYSAIAENEMTYVVGGGAVLDFLGSFTAPVWTVDNLKTFNTNVVTIIGNKYASALVDNTLGMVFRGYGDTTVKENVKTGWNKMFGSSNHSAGAIFLNLIGTGAAIYNMGRANVSISLPESTTDYEDDGYTYVYMVN